MFLIQWWEIAFEHCSRHCNKKEKKKALRKATSKVYCYPATDYVQPTGILTAFLPSRREVDDTCGSR